MKKEDKELEEKPLSGEEQPSAETAKPAKKTVSEHPALKPKEVEEIVVSLANQGIPASEIGVILRDQHGVPKAKIVANKTIGEILQSHKLTPEIPEDLLSLIRKAVSLDTHLQKNKKDYSAKRGYQLTVSKIRRLVTYYHKNKRLPAKWRYNIENARLLVK